MKTQYFLFFFVSICSILSCQKERIEEHPEYVGEWEYASVYRCSDQVHLTPFMTITEDGRGEFRRGITTKGKVRFKENELCIGSRSYEITEPPTKYNWIFYNYSGSRRKMNWAIKIIEPARLGSIEPIEYYMGRFDHSEANRQSILTEYQGIWHASNDVGDFTLAFNPSSDTSILLHIRNQNDTADSVYAFTNTASFSQSDETIFILKSDRLLQLSITPNQSSLNLNFGGIPQYHSFNCGAPDVLDNPENSIWYLNVEFNQSEN